jgi:glycosyltransferase involved in cell wall biosynthesis
MRVLLAHSSSSAGSVYHRVNQPARAVQEADAGVQVTARVGITTTMRPPTDGGEPVVADVDAEGADVVVLQLPKTAEMLQCIHLLQAQGVAVVVEMDDLMSAVPYGHAGHRSLIRRGMARWGLECARAADFVTVSTPALLAEYAGHGRGAVVANAVPRSIAELPPAYERRPDVVTVGWAGTVFGHPYDLQEMGSGLRQAMDRTRGASRFTVIGQKGDARTRLGLAEEPDEVPWLHEVHEYLALLGEVLDVGIAPLRMDSFNISKSWLKPLEYAARGVFCVRARTPEYERLGLGLPAKAPKDWAKWIAVGVEDADRRRELAAAAREQVLAHHLTEHRAGQWIDAWRAALEHRARTRPSGVAVSA